MAKATTTATLTNRAGLTPRASRAACSMAAGTLYQQAQASGTLPTATMVKLGQPYQPRGGQPNGQRAALVACVQAALAQGALAWGALANKTFTFATRTGTNTNRVGQHLTFLLGNQVITKA